MTIINPSRAAFGRRIREARLANGLSIRDLAAHVQAAQPTISNIEAGRYGASAELQARLLAALGLLDTSSDSRPPG